MVAIICSWFCTPVHGQPSNLNYDESKVGAYTLPDPLQTERGKRITSARQWPRQRSVILKQFAEHVYGTFPEKPVGMRFEVTSIDSTALNGKATRKQIRILFTRAPDAPYLDLLLYLPNQAQSPVLVFLGLNYFGNQSVHPDSGIAMSTRWMGENEAFGIVNNRATEKTRGAHQSRWPIEEILSRGYGVATLYYGDLEPDHAEGWQTGIRTTLQNELRTKPDEWGAIGAWAWGLSRAMDYLETDPDVNAGQVAVMGHSRHGKATLWAGANDQRFAMVISNDSGEGGATLSRRNFGETIEQINTSFPYWFNAKYKTYNGKPDQLPVDQHLLLSLMAPRPLYVASAEDDKWADPKGEFLSAVHAAPVYQLFGKMGVGVAEQPAVNQPVGETIGYHIRNGKHDITLYDWQQYLNFADKHFKKAAK